MNKCVVCHRAIYGSYCSKCYGEVDNPDKINSPSHYTQGKTEVIDIIEQLTEGMDGKRAYKLGNVVKYIFRHEHKGGKEDLEKALWYLNRAIEGYGEELE